MTRKQIVSLLRQAVDHWVSHRASRMGASLAYYAVFSIVPLLSLVVVIAGASLGHAYIRTELGHEIGSMIGPESGEFIRSLLAAGSEAPGVIASVVGFAVLAIGTLSMLRELKRSLDDLWDVSAERRFRKRWVRNYILAHLISLSLIPVLALLLILSLVFSSLLALAGPDAGIWIKLGTTAFSVTITGLLFAFIYRYIPSRTLPWKEVAGGALATALLFLAGKAVIGFYLARYAGASDFGAAGALVVILLFIYYSVQIFFFGASLTYVWSRRYGYLKDQD